MNKLITTSVLFGLLIGSSTLFAQENLTVSDQLLVPNMDTTIETESGLVVLDGQGQAKLLSFPNFLVGAYGDDCIIHDLAGGTTSVSPVWQSEGLPNNSSLGYLFTGSECPANVGIGTSTPRTRLDVIGTTYSSKLAIGVDPQSMIGKVHINTNRPAYLDETALRIENQSRIIFEVNNNGLVRAREIKVDVDVWPDYVFEEEYQLMPLNDIENFIDQNGHLPNIPSAETMETEGMNVLEMNKMLMEKIEELTLHMIEQQKRIEAQNTRLSELESK